ARRRRRVHQLPAPDVAQRRARQFTQRVDEPELGRRQLQRPGRAKDRLLDAAPGGPDQQSDVLLFTQHLPRQVTTGPGPGQAFETNRQASLDRSTANGLWTSEHMTEPAPDLWQRVTGPARKTARFFPWERALVMMVAAVVGLYGGIAAGLFATAIRFVQLILFRGREVAVTLFGPEREMWARYFAERLHGARWHL